MKHETIDPTVASIANDNVEIACAFIQKKAIEKAIPGMGFQNMLSVAIKL